MSPFETPSATALRADLEAKGVRYALASFVDLHGVSKAKAVPLSHLGQMLQGSELFTGAALDGVPQEVSDDEVAAVPDPASATVLPWQKDVAWFASDLHLHGQPFEACSRNILNRVREQAASMGYRFNLGIETEFSVLRRDASRRSSAIGRSLTTTPSMTITSRLRTRRRFTGSRGQCAFTAIP